MRNNYCVPVFWSDLEYASRVSPRWFALGKNSRATAKNPDFAVQQECNHLHPRRTDVPPLSHWKRPNKLALQGGFEGVPGE